MVWVDTPRMGRLAPGSGCGTALTPGGSTTVVAVPVGAASDGVAGAATVT